jgi:hypothetical protein
MKKKRNQRNQNLFFMLAGLLLLFIGFARLTHVSYSSHYEEEYYPVDNYTQFADYNYQANEYLQENEIATPLYLQTNEDWADLSYGTDGEQTVAENGCAILSLSMMLAYLRNEEVWPDEVLDWAGDQYYVQGQGTDWQIFADFADAFDFSYHDLGTDIDQVTHYLKAGHPVIVSVGAGDFTDTGHIMVLATMKGDTVTVLDPNDSPEKNHTTTSYTLDEIANQSLHFWTFTRKSISSL